jgi:mannosyl-glycoprotein endo-beta-N-acetylglucosaminidase
MEKFQSEQISNKPIRSFKSLLLFNPNKHNEYNVEDLKLSSTSNNRKERKFLVCHDMKNNYLEDKYYQGSNESKSFEFYHWQYIDMFIYFSHHFVTIPPEQWINASHENNCRCLGTLITEWKDGTIICNEMLKDEQTIDLTVNKLVELCLFYKFDGWLINIENPVVNNVTLLILLCDKLTKSLKKLDSNRYRVIWYDSVIQTGELKWQNELNSLNECFFNVCDAIFINYTWKDENLKKCIDFSDKKRLNDIYIGVDVFGRGCLGNGGFNTNVALEKISEYNDLSCALFAPGWLHECNAIDEFIQNTDKFWNLLEKYVYKRKITQLPLITTFSHSRADKFYLNGKLMNDSSYNAGWSNLSLQSKMPIYDNWCFDDAFYAGNCILIPNDNKMITLFEFNLELTSSLVIDYAFKSESNKSLDVYLNYNEQEIFQINNLTNNNKDIKVIGVFESNINDWKLIKCKIEFLNSNICLNSIQMQTSSTTKLGLLRMYDANESTSSSHFDFNITETKQHLFCLNNETYLLVYIEWNPNKHAKYYNVFIDDFLNNQISSKYIGSTRSNDYKLCLKLNKNKIKFNSNKQEEEEEESPNYFFRINIQLVDYLLVNLNEPMNKIMIKMNNGLDIDDNLNEIFYDQVIYDFELF